MSRSYHVTRKAAEQAMDEGDLEPTWEASEKADVKIAVTQRRDAGRTIKSLTGRELRKMPNRAFVAKEKSRTLGAKTNSLGLYEKLETALTKILTNEKGA